MPKLTRERIVSAAHTAVHDTGHERLALRALARDLGVTAPALYDHFDSKDTLLRAVAAQGFRSLIEATSVSGNRAVVRLRERALAYVNFAIDNPELFRLMFLFRPAAVELVDETGQEVENELGAATDAFDEGTADLIQAIDDGDVVDRDPIQLGLILWASMHGVATVALTAPSVATAVAEDVIATLLAGLKPGP